MRTARHKDGGAARARGRWAPFRPVAALGALVLAVTAAACSTSSGGSASTSSSTAATARLDAALHQLVTAPGGPPGAIVVVQRGSAIQVHAAGVAREGSTAPPLASDHVRIGSVSKAMNGAAALALVAQGKLSLDTTVGQVLPTLSVAWHGVTLAQLLNHTSGIPDYSTSPGFQNALRASLTVAPPPEQLLSYVSAEPLRFPPGTRYAYSNSDNVIVGLMIQAASGLPYATALKRYVYTPIGLSQTGLPATVAMPPPYIHGYDAPLTGSREDVSETFSPGWAWASGGIVSTPGEANRFIRSYARGGTTSPAVHNRQFRFHPGATSEPPGPGANAAGLGIFRYQTSCGTVYGHTGNTLGYTAFVAANANGTRSVSVTVSQQVSPKTDSATFPALRHVFELAVCAALAG